MARSRRESQSSAGHGSGRAAGSDAVLEAAVGEYIYEAAMGRPVDDFAESFPTVREVQEERSRLTSLIDQLLDIAQTAECQNCNFRFSNVKRGCNECEGARAAIQDAIDVCVKAGRTAMGRTGPCPAPVVLDPPPERCHASIPYRTGDVSHAECSLPKAHPGAHHDKQIGTRWTDGDDYA